MDDIRESMTLDDAIQHCNEVANTCDNKGCALDHKQLATWLSELKSIKEREEHSSLYMDVWAGRNKNGIIWLFSEKPIRFETDGSWVTSIHKKDSYSSVAYNTKIGELNKNQLLDLKWEDEPIKICLLSHAQLKNIEKDAYKDGYDSGYDSCIENEF